jgi:predicted MFS family arabinose efflux permease
MRSISHAAGKHEQGRMQGAASSVESLGRTVGPVWGTAALQHFGDSTPYISAAAFLLVTLVVSIGSRFTDPDISGV